MSDKHFMQAALQLAERAQRLDEVPIGAIVVFDNQIVAEAHNQTRALNDPTAHAEVIALREAGRRLKNFRLIDATLFVTVEPCLMCSGALLEARISRLVYGAREPRSGAVVSTAETLLSPRCTHHIAVTEGVLKEACSELLQHFFQRKR